MPTPASQQASSTCPVIQRANRALNSRSQVKVLTRLQRELQLCQDCASVESCPSYRALAQLVEAASRTTAAGGRCV